MSTVRGRLATGDGVEITVDDDRISSVEPADVVDGLLVLPGLVDIHCHGGGGASLTSGDADEVRTAAAHHLAHGTTSLVGSVVTDAPDRMLRAIEILAQAVDDGHLAAVHLEGPFLLPVCCGAQDPAHLRDPDLGLASRLLEAGRGHVRVVTVAPELPGADDLAALLVERGAVVAAGHTAADVGTMHRFLARPGHGLVTHLFNGMPPMHHRDPGPVAASMAAAAAGDATVELIADGVHVSDEMAATVLALVGADHVALVTDAMAAAGMPDGDYELGPQRVRVTGGVARLADGDSIAGGTARLVDVVRRLVAGGLDLAAVVTAATRNPARVLALDAGSLEVGARADLAVVTPDLEIVQVMRAGEWVS